MKNTDSIIQKLASIPYEDRDEQHIAAAYYSTDESYSYGDSVCEVEARYGNNQYTWTAVSGSTKGGMNHYWHQLLTTIPFVNVRQDTSTMMGIVLMGVGTFANALNTAKAVRSVLALATPTPGKTIGDLLANMLGYTDWAITVRRDKSQAATPDQAYFDVYAASNATYALMHSDCAVWAPVCTAITDDGSTTLPEDYVWNHLVMPVTYVITSNADQPLQVVTYVGTQGPGLLKAETIEGTRMYKFSLPLNIIRTDDQNMQDLNQAAQNAAVAAVTSAVSSRYLRY